LRTDASCANRVCARSTTGARQGPGDLDVARAVMATFVEALAEKRFEGAYARMAEPYRSQASLEPQQ
jgi:hypothetical protein